MGSGIAKQVKDRFPNTYQKYVDSIRQNGDSRKMLGGVLLTSELLNDKSIFIANLFAQDRFGVDKRYTSYDALQLSLHRLSCMIDEIVTADKDSNYPRIAIPYMMSCDRGGGSWRIVYALIYDELCNRNVQFYRLN